MKISEFHRKNLKKRADTALVKARVEAVKWHNAQKSARLQMASDQASETLGNIDLKNDAIAELSLAMLYLGEGSKKSSVGSPGTELEFAL